MTDTPTLSAGALALLREACANRPSAASGSIDDARELGDRGLGTWYKVSRGDAMFIAGKVGVHYLATLDATPAPDGGGGERRCEPMTLRPRWVEYLSWLASKDDATLTDYGQGEAMLARNLLTWGDKIDGPNAHPPAAAPGVSVEQAAWACDVCGATGDGVIAGPTCPECRSIDYLQMGNQAPTPEAGALWMIAHELRQANRPQPDAVTDAPSTAERIGRLERAVEALVEALGGAVDRIDYHPKARDWSAALVLDGDGLDKLSEARAALGGEEG